MLLPVSNALLLHLSERWKFVIRALTIIGCLTAFVIGGCPPPFLIVRPAGCITHGGGSIICTTEDVEG